MNFSDNIVRAPLDIVCVIRTSEEMEAREEHNSNLWEMVRHINKKTGVNMYATPARDVKYGESIFSKNGEFIAYRVN